MYPTDNSHIGFFRKPALKVIFIAVCLCLAIVAVVWGRAFYSSMHACQQGERYLEKDQYVKAITFFDRSIHWHTPFNPYVSRSARYLWEICEQAERQGDVQLALIAVRTIRQGFLGTRSFYTPGEDWIRRCDDKIVSLTAGDSGGEDLNPDRALSRSLHGAQEPDIFWTLILEIGLFGWIGSVIGFLLQGLTRGGSPKLRSGPAVFWGIMTIVFYVLWILGMTRA